MFDEVGSRSRGAGRVGGLLGAVVLVAVGAAGVLWWSRAPDQSPPVSYGVVVPVDQRHVGDLDLGRVHRELWPAWVLARDDAGRAAATSAVAEALAAEPALAALASEIGAAADVDVGSWNAAMTARGAPWALSAGRDAALPYVKSYWLPARPAVRFGEREARVRVGLRVDRLGIVESWLGAADDVGEPVVVVDRVAEFAFDRLWTALDPADADPLSAAVRAAARDALGDEVTDRLAASAPGRRAMVAARAGVDARRDRCGSRFVVRLGWAGVDELRPLYDWAERERTESCPGITRGEAEAIARGTVAVRGDPALPAALERLVAWAARHVVVHEARHQLDHEDWGAGVAPPCAECPIDGRARIEASAYLSALASADGLVAWVQGCEVVEYGGAAGAALTALGGALGLDCAAAPPADLAARAAALSRRWFGRDEVIEVRDLPDALPFALVSG